MTRPRPRARLSALIAATLAACAFSAAVSPAPASAQNQPNAKLDAVAADVAGHRSTVWCETSWPDWLATVAREDPSSGEIAAEGVNGFTVIEKPVVYVSPRQCETLSAAIEFGHRQVGSYYLASAMLTLVHEAVHQRGVLDEGVADCTALALLPRVATRFFGYNATSRVVVRVHGRLVRRTVADSALADLLRFASAWHRSKPAAYQGRC
jgi:hypothetical protein